MTANEPKASDTSQMAPGDYESRQPDDSETEIPKAEGQIQTSEVTDADKEVPDDGDGPFTKSVSPGPSPDVIPSDREAESQAEVYTDVPVSDPPSSGPTGGFRFRGKPTSQTSTGNIKSRPKPK